MKVPKVPINPYIVPKRFISKNILHTEVNDAPSY